MAVRIHQMPARSGGDTSRPGSGPARPSAAVSPMSQLLEPLLAQAEQLVRSRMLLPAVDWAHATAEQVERLLGRLTGAKLNVPAWLAKGLLVAGHRLPAASLQSCSPELQVLATLSCIDEAGYAEAMTRQILDLAQHGDMEEGVAAALVARLVSLGQTSLACRIALCQSHTAPRALRHVRDHLAAEIAAMPQLRLRVTGTSTIQGLSAALKPAFAAIGRRLDVSEADFGSVIAELLTPDEAADGLVILLDREHFATADWRRTAEEARKLLDEQLEVLAGALEAYARNAAKPILINLLPVSAAPLSGHIDRHHATGDAALVAEINRRLAQVAATASSLHVVDADLALADIAPIERSDPKLWYYGRMAYSDAATRALARGFARMWQARERGAAKVLALDFDNTLWGGVFGDDGIARLQCGDDFPGNAFKALQQECLRLKSQGMLLVGLSKNNPEALDVFARHPGMALNSDDLVASAVNWEPKPENIRKIAAELGLGLDSFVFLDDSPHEREAMRRMCPSVIVPEMPADPAKRPLWLRRLACTWPVRLTEEDARRSAMYAAERKGRELRETSGSYEEYLSGLQQHLVVEPVSSETLARAAQLHQRTNQFNLTNLRLSEGDLRAYMSDASRLAVVGRASDRFGDYGIVLAACVAIDGPFAKIDTLVMSCRVIGRQLEAAFLEALAGHLFGRGVEEIEGRYHPTERNGLVRDLYRSMGYSASPQDGDAAAWSLQRQQGSAPGLRPVTLEWNNT